MCLNIVKQYTERVVLGDLPRPARWYILGVICLGALTLAVMLLRHPESLSPILPLLLFVVLSSLTSAFKVQFPIASGSNMSVSYVVDIASLILRGPHATMIVGAASGWSQTTLNSRQRNPTYRTLFNMSILALTVQAAGQVYLALGGTTRPDLSSVAVLVPLGGMALTYFVVNTVPIAIAIAMTTDQSARRVWTTQFLPSLSSYVFGVAAAAAVIAVTESSGYWLTLLLAAAPLYLTFKVYRAGVKTEARQGAILDAASDAIVTMDHEFAIREFNPAAERMFGCTRIDMLGRHIDTLLPTSERVATMKALAEYMLHGEGPLKGAQFEMLARRADDTEFPVELTVARLGGDKRAAITGFIRDITERRGLEERLRQSQKLEAIGRLAGGVAHDFNNILMSIMGSADLLLMDLTPGHTAHDEANEIKQSVQRGAGLTRQLLAFSRRQATSPRLFALGDAISGMETMLRRLMGPEIDIVTSRPPEPTMVIADQAQIEQVVLNLVVNARDAMPDGGRLTVKIEEVELDESEVAPDGEGRAGRYACLSVSDTGTGIDDQTRARLFEPFFTTKDQGKGTGLGLSIVYGIVKQSGGHITVVSEPGKGATFNIYLPIATIAAPPSPALV
jgi:PAS domain S-box-containing protein